MWDNNNIIGDDREHSYLCQRISIAVQYFNSVLLHDGFDLFSHSDVSLIYISC